MIFKSLGLENSVLVWVPPEKDLETRIPWGVVYLEGGPRKQGGKEWAREREEEADCKGELIKQLPLWITGV